MCFTSSVVLVAFDSVRLIQTEDGGGYMFVRQQPFTLVLRRTLILRKREEELNQNGQQFFPVSETPRRQQQIQVWQFKYVRLFFVESG